MKLALVMLMLQGCTVSYVEKKTATTYSRAYQGEVKADLVTLLMGAFVPAPGAAGLFSQSLGGWF